MYTNKKYICMYKIILYSIFKSSVYNIKYTHYNNIKSCVAVWPHFSGKKLILFYYITTRSVSSSRAYYIIIIVLYNKI